VQHSSRTRILAPRKRSAHVTKVSLKIAFLQSPDLSPMINARFILRFHITSCYYKKVHRQEGPLFGVPNVLLNEFNNHLPLLRDARSPTNVGYLHEFAGMLLLQSLFRECLIDRGLVTRLVRAGILFSIHRLSFASHRWR